MRRIISFLAGWGLVVAFWTNPARAADTTTSPSGPMLGHALPKPSVRFVTKTGDTSHTTVETITPGLSTFPVPPFSSVRYNKMVVSSAAGTTTATYSPGANPADVYFPDWEITYTGIYGPNRFLPWYVTTALWLNLELYLADATNMTPTSVTKPARAPENFITWTLSDPAPPPSTRTKTTTVRGSTDFTEAVPLAYLSGNQRNNCEYKAVASSALIGTTVLWAEIYTPADGTAKRYTYRPWTIQGKESPSYTLACPANGSATVELYELPELAVDANRDGEVRFPHEDNSDQTSSSTTYARWLNDDDDERVTRSFTANLSTYTENEQDDKEITSDANKDCNNLVIDTERDLEDLARLWICTAGLTDALKNDTLRLGLKWTDVSSGTPAVRLFKAVEADGRNAYLFTPGTATLQVDQTAVTGAHGMAVGSLIEGTNPVPLPAALFANLTESQPKTYLLFEGTRAGKGQLKLVILDQNDQPIGEGPGVWIEMNEPHKFVERYTCGDASLGAVGALTHYTPSATFGVPTTEDEKDYVLYVHGYNMEDPEKQRWIETAFKRLYLLGYKGRVGGFSWPCAVGLVDQIRFDESEERAWQAGARLQEHLQNLKNAGYRVHVVAHSQGNVVTGEALRLWRAEGNATALVNTYIASQAAVAAHSYNAAAPLMPDYEQTTPNVYAVYWRAGDSARFPQTWPATNPPYFADSIIQTTAGRWVNFYNPQDYALTAANGGTISWETDQRWKPNNGYSWSVTNGFYKGLVPFETSYGLPDDRYAIFSFCAEARSVALGTNATGGIFGSSGVDLEAQFGYSRAHLWHSAQFRSFMAARQEYWAELLRRIGIQPYTP